MTYKISGALIALSFVALQSFGADDIPEPQDKPYPGEIDLQVDATNVRQRIFEIHERIPVTSGKVTLLYPKWRLGAHAPVGQLLNQFAGLILTGNQHRIEWQRDPLDVFAFHIDVPAGVSTIEAEFQFLSPTEANQGAVVATEEMLAVHWEAMVLYPAGYYAHGITFKPSVVFPKDWQFAGALQLAQQAGGEAQFKPVNLEELIDSPLYAGKYFNRIDLDPGAKAPVFLDLFGDSRKVIEGSAQQIQAHRALVQQAYKLFGSRHYDHYDFLVAISDVFSFAGLEHQQSGENGVRSTYFSEWDKQQNWRSSLISHEYTHSWDGKFRRPGGQLIPNFNEPMDDSLLWVYEGGTSYWGQLLAARSGLVETSQMRDALAASGALYDHRIGRRWRNLADTSNEPIISTRTPLGWQSWQRAEDYYAEGELIWFDADTKIRELSGDKRSLDDFARAFFGVQDGRHAPPLPYSFEDVVHALNAVQPFDWADFLHIRLYSHGPGAPLDGFARSGWSLVYTEEPSDFSRDADAYRHVVDFGYSLGFSVTDDGHVLGIVWDSLAFKAGLSGGNVLLAVNGRSFKPELLRDAVTAAKSSREPIELLFKKDDRYRTEKFDYHEGLKYPHLKRIAGTKDRLQDIFKPI